MRQVALLRGINVGKAKRVAMADLRRVMERLGYSDVRTLLNSGNIVFTGPAGARTAQRIQDAVARELKVVSRVTVLTADDLRRILAENSLLPRCTDPTRLLVTVLYDAEGRKKILPLVRESWGNDALAVGQRAVYLWCPAGMLQSKMAERVAKLLGDAATARNWATMQKLAAAL